MTGWVDPRAVASTASAASPSERKWVALRRVPELALLSDRKLRRLARSVEIADLPQGSVLVRQGESGRRAFLVVDGFANVTIGQRALATSGPGDVVGAIAMLDPEARNVTVRAATPMTVLEVGPQGFRELVAQTPLAFLVATQLAHLLGLLAPKTVELSDREISLDITEESTN